jgi:hypothetical protein
MKRTIRKNMKRTKNSRAVTTYDTSKPETATPQKVREGNEASGEFERMKSAQGK